MLQSMDSARSYLLDDPVDDSTDSFCSSKEGGMGVGVEGRCHRLALLDAISNIRTHTSYACKLV